MRNPFAHFAWTESFLQCSNTNTVKNKHRVFIYTFTGQVQTIALIHFHLFVSTSKIRHKYHSSWQLPNIFNMFPRRCQIGQLTLPCFFLSSLYVYFTEVSILFRGTRVPVLPFTPKRKVRPSLSRFSWNSQKHSTASCAHNLYRISPKSANKRSMYGKKFTSAPVYNTPATTKNFKKPKITQPISVNMACNCRQKGKTPFTFRRTVTISLSFHQTHNCSTTLRGHLLCRISHRSVKE
jgi:hypothetical protein